MNYKQIYKNFINNKKLLIREKGDGNYYEKHHIIPKSIGGDNSKENMVLLTAKEHYFAHLLLVEIYDGKEKIKMRSAFWMMHTIGRGQNRIKICSKKYDLIRKQMSIERKGKKCGSENSFFGKKHSDETKKKLSEMTKIRANNGTLPLPPILKGEFNRSSKKYICINHNKNITYFTNGGINKFKKDFELSSNLFHNFLNKGICYSIDKSREKKFSKNTVGWEFKTVDDLKQLEDIKFTIYNVIKFRHF